MSLADARIREAKPSSFIYEKERALPADVKYIATTWVCFA